MTLTPVRARIESAISFVREGKGGYRAASEATGVTYDVVRRECKALGMEDIKPKARSLRTCSKCFREFERAPAGRSIGHNFNANICTPCWHARAKANLPNARRKP